MERVETKISRDLMEAVRVRAAMEKRDDTEIIEEALTRYLKESSGGLGDLLDRMAEGRRQRGVPEPSEEEVMKLAVEEQHAWRRERRETSLAEALTERRARRLPGVPDEEAAELPEGETLSEAVLAEREDRDL